MSSSVSPRRAVLREINELEAKATAKTMNEKCSPQRIYEYIADRQRMEHCRGVGHGGDKQNTGERKPRHVVDPDYENREL